MPMAPATPDWVRPCVRRLSGSRERTPAVHEQMHGYSRMHGVMLWIHHSSRGVKIRPVPRFRVLDGSHFVGRPNHLQEHIVDTRDL